MTVQPYQSPWWLPGGHLQTLVPSLLGYRENPGYRRERLELGDGDFVDLDWLTGGSVGLVLLLHGLEGSSCSPYIVAMARAIRAAHPARDVLAFNFRGCSGEPNRMCRFYHSGETGDLREVLAAIPESYRSIALIGFSLGGNVLLKYLGEAPERVDSRVEAAVAFSVPCHLASSAEVLAHPFNRFYMKRFLTTLERKVRHHAERFPDSIKLDGVGSMRTFREFDGRFTAPLHGFRDADDYWEQSSSLQFLPGIRVPTLLVNARNDPFLSPECFPEASALDNPNLDLEFPATGGHAGFPGRGQAGLGWRERRAIQFLNTQR
jgi:predicted alpha/beta-fold hydrolase